jgi:phage shock protein A
MAGEMEADQGTVTLSGGARLGYLAQDQGLDASSTIYEEALEAKREIIEMEQQVDEATQALGQAMGSQKMAAKELADAMAKSADWNDKAKLALKAGNEELARKALECKVNVDASIEPLQKSYDEITANVNKMKDQVTTLKMKLDEARARQQILIARSKMADAAQQAATSISSASSDSAFSKLEKLEERVAQKEATAEAFTELNVTDMAIADEFEDIAHSAAVEDEMARLKKELGL